MYGKLQDNMQLLWKDLRRQRRFVLAQKEDQNSNRAYDLAGDVIFYF